MITFKQYFLESNAGLDMTPYSRSTSDIEQRNEKYLLIRSDADKRKLANQLTMQQIVVLLANKKLIAIDGYASWQGEEFEGSLHAQEYIDKYLKTLEVLSPEDRTKAIQINLKLLYPEEMYGVKSGGLLFKTDMTKKEAEEYINNSGGELTKVNNAYGEVTDQEWEWYQKNISRNHNITSTINFFSDLIVNESPFRFLTSWGSWLLKK